ncbi:hypothetical protein ECG_07649 [Echinococcus granulosus]|nr:hypothetical protein ECG_07649 [Echinococcus granulosus]
MGVFLTPPLITFCSYYETTLRRYVRKHEEYANINDKHLTTRWQVAYDLAYSAKLGLHNETFTGALTSCINVIVHCVVRIVTALQRGNGWSSVFFKSKAQYYYNMILATLHYFNWNSNCD